MHRWSLKDAEEFQNTVYEGISLSIDQVQSRTTEELHAFVEETDL